MRTNLNESLTSIINTSIKNYRGKIPYLANLLVTSTTGAIFVPPETAKVFENDSALMGSVIHANRYILHDRNIPGVCSAFPSKEKTTNAFNYAVANKVIGLDLDYYSELEKQLLKKQTIFVLDHEIGHLVADIPYGLSGNQNESAADAFATLMHIKRYGKDSAQLPLFPYHASKSIYSGAVDYYTTPVIFAVTMLNKEIDVEKLTYKDVIWYSKELSKKYALPQDKSHKLYNYFGNTESDDGHKSLYERTMAKKDDIDIFRYGETLLALFFIDGSIDRKDLYWVEAAKNITAHARKTKYERNPISEDSIKEMVANKARLESKGKLTVKWM